MKKTFSDKFFLFLLKLKKWLRFWPNSGFFWLDIFYVLLIIVIQQTIIPDLLNRFIVIDLLTPWLVTNIVVQRNHRAFILCLIGALALETRSSAPAGLYLSIYWVMCSLILLFRGYLSWQYVSSWAFVLCLAPIWTATCECLVMVLTDGQFSLSASFIFIQIIRCMISFFFGFWWTEKYRQGIFAGKDALATIVQI